MGYFAKLMLSMFLLAPMLLSSMPYKKSIVMEPIIIQAMLCLGDDRPEMSEIHGWEKTYQITSGCRSPSTRHTDIALNAFLKAWVLTKTSKALA